MIPVRGALAAPGRARPSRAPAAALRRASWREVELAAVEYAEDEEGRRRWAGVPVARGRILLSEAVLETAPAAAGEEAGGLLAPLLDGRFVVAWSAPTVVPILGGALGGGWGSWARRTVEVRRLLRLLGTPVVGGTEAEERARAAAAHRVPVPRACDPLDGALTTAQLFLVLATKLEAAGRGDVASLLG